MHREIFQTDLSEFHSKYGKNRQRCQQNKFYYAVWQLLLYFYKEFPSKILSVCVKELPHRVGWLF